MSLGLDLTKSTTPLRGFSTPTFTRATYATFLNSDYSLTTVGSGVARNTYKGFLVEKGSINRISYRRDFSGWIARGTASVTVDQAVGIDGNQKADQISVGAETTDDLYTVATGYTASTNLPTLIAVKKISSTGTLNIQNPAGVAYGKYQVDLSLLSTGWELITKDHAAVTTVNPFISDGSGIGGLQLFASSGTISFYADFAHQEEGAFLTSIIADGTEGSTLTRDPDKLSYSSESINSTDFTILLKSVYPIAAGADYADSEVRLFGTNDSRGTAYEVRTIGDTAYGYTHGTGGGEFAVKKSDLVKNTAANFAFSLSQEGANVRAIIYRNKVEVLNTTTAGTLDHSNSGLEVGYWAADIFSCYIKSIRIYSRVLTPAEFISET